MPEATVGFLAIKAVGQETATVITEHDVVMAYRLILGREPENSTVVDGKVRHLQTLEDLRQVFLTSPEFLALSRTTVDRLPTELGCKATNWPGIQVDVDVTPATLRRMTARIEREFVDLGEQEPYWSVLAEERFKSQNIRGNEAEFFNSGELMVEGLVAASNRCGIDLSRYRSCFELGCGLGRITLWLAQRFEQVIASDISALHLSLTMTAARRAGIDNISYAHLNKLGAYNNLPAFDCFFSIIVLQHNPPPLIAWMLRRILARLAPGGIAFFQVPTYMLGYRFDVKEYLATPPVPDQVELHCLPQKDLFEIVEGADCRVLEIREDGAVGLDAISNRLLVQKSEQAQPNRSVRQKR